MLLGAERTRVGSLLEVGPVTPVLRGDLNALGIGTDHTRKRQQHDRVIESDVVQRHVLEQARGARLGALGGAFGRRLGDVGAIAAVLGHDEKTGLGVLTEFEFEAGGSGQEFLGLVESELIGREVFGDVGAGRLLGAVFGLGERRALDIRAITADADRDALGERERREFAGVDVAESVDEELETSVAFAFTGPETLQDIDALFAAAGDFVEDIFEVCGEAIVDEPTEMLFHQPDDRERDPGRHQSRALLIDIAAILDGVDDRGVSRGPADLTFFEVLDQAGFGETRRRTGFVGGRTQFGDGDRVAFADIGKLGLLVFAVCVGFFLGLDIGLEESVERDSAAAGTENDIFAGRSRGADADRHRISLGVLHL